MKKKIKGYTLSDNMTINKLKKNGFKEDDFINKIPTPKYYYNEFLVYDIELHIEIAVNSDGTFNFDDIDNIYVIDDNFGQPYYPFYSDNHEFGFLNKVIFRYNQVMDKFVEKGILKSKELENEDKVKKLIK